MKHSIIFKRVEKNFDNREQAKIWILNNQLGRRNLNDAQRIEVVDRLFGLKEEQEAKKRMLSGKKDPSPNQGKGSASRLAPKAKVGRGTICCDMKTISELSSGYQNKTSSNYKNCVFRTTMDDERVKVGIDNCVEYIEKYFEKM